MLMLTVTEMARNFAEYVNRVAYRRESFVLVRGNRPLAEIRPLPTVGRLGDLPALFDAVPHLDADDVDAFADAIDTARAELDAIKVRDPWES